jgi:hypothetical protein
MASEARGLTQAFYQFYSEPQLWVFFFLIYKIYRVLLTELWHVKEIYNRIPASPTTKRYDIAYEIFSCTFMYLWREEKRRGEGRGEEKHHFQG